MDKKNILFTVLGIIIALAVVLAFRGFGSIGGKETASLAPALNQEEEDFGLSGIEDDDPYLGAEDALVTMVEFSDYQCPFCARFYLETFSKIKEEYIDTGKVKFVYRDFPLNIHQYAQKAAEASECAQEQGGFWEYKDVLFKKQAEWSSGGITKFKEYAGQLGLNQEQFDSCLDSGDMAQEVQKDFNDGRQYGVSGTPAFIINGEFISGAQPYSVFKQAIDKALE